MLTIQDLRTQIFNQDPPVKAVDGVTFQISAGETIALVGESGCGKTMLALSLTRLLPPAARVVHGRILFDGLDLATLNPSEMRKIRGGKIGYIFQDPMSSLNPVMSIGEQLAEAVQLHQNGNRRSAWQAAQELLEKVQIHSPGTRLRQYPHQLSGGQRQRVMIAMALAGNPALLIADEPTSALDVTTQAEIFELLAQLKSELNMSILMITHDLTAVAPYADRMMVMYAGRIVEAAPAKQLMESPAHPYSQALLRCLPPLGQGRHSLETISGSVPDLSHTPTGCPFHPRCSEAKPRCQNEEPRLAQVQKNHWVSCWERSPERGSDPLEKGV